MPKGEILGVAAVMFVAQAGGELGGAAGAWMSAGLGGGIVAWLLLRHLPSTEAQRAAQDKAHAEHVEALAKQAGVERTEERDRFAEMMAQQRTDFRDALIQQRRDQLDALDLVVKHSKESSLALAGVLSKELAALGATVAALGQVVSQSRTQYEALTQRNPQ